MGTILAAFFLPRVILGPFSGALTDRIDRKMLLILSDTIRGILFVVVGLLLLLKVFPFLFIFPVVIISGACSSFFNPAVSSIIPEIVSDDHLTKANSMREMSSSLSQMIGSSIGGVLYALLANINPNEAAVVMFSANGISFLYAAVSQTFMKIPKIESFHSTSHILSEMVDGFRYTYKHYGLKILLIMAMIINFFAMMGMTLFAPLYNETPGFGTQNYGYSMGLLMAGGFLGLILLSFMKTKHISRYAIFVSSVLFMIALMILASLLRLVGVMFLIAFLVGGFYAITNVIRQTAVQLTTPPEMRGKVFGIMGTFVEGLMPLSTALGGVIAEFAGVRPTMLFSFILAGVAVVPMFFSKKFRDYMNSNSPITEP